jgi:hypothetical protein
MKFLEISPSARSHPRNWIGQNSKRDDIAAENSEAIPTPTSHERELVPLKRYRSATRRQFIWGVFLGASITSAVAIPIAKYSGSPKQVAAPPPAASAQTALANSGPQARGSVPAPVSDASRGSFAFPAGKTPRPTQTGDSPYDPFRSTPVRHSLQAIDKPSPGNPPAPSVVLAQSREAETKSAKKSVASPQQLWSAVQAGNVQAALTLADIYLRGDGVPANCDQARVLLLVASKKGSAVAIKKLKELDATGCPTAAPAS